jgi:hypothetical protein
MLHNHDLLCIVDDHMPLLRPVPKRFSADRSRKGKRRIGGYPSMNPLQSLRRKSPKLPVKRQSRRVSHPERHFSLLDLF